MVQTKSVTLIGIRSDMRKPFIDSYQRQRDDHSQTPSSSKLWILHTTSLPSDDRAIQSGSVPVPRPKAPNEHRRPDNQISSTRAHNQMCAPHAGDGDINTGSYSWSISGRLIESHKRVLFSCRTSKNPHEHMCVTGYVYKSAMIHLLELFPPMQLTNYSSTVVDDRHVQ